MSLEEIASEKIGNIAYRRERYGGGRFRAVKLLAGAGQGYALLTEDMWCGGLAVLKGLWWEQGSLRDDSWPSKLDRNTARQLQGLKAIYQAMQLTQQAPTVIDFLPEQSPTLEAFEIDAGETLEYFAVSEFVGIAGRPVRTLADEIRTRREQNRPFAEDELLDLADQLCGALGALHARRLVKRRTSGRSEEYWIHADLKPENVLVLGPPAQYVLIDYDAAVVDGQPIGVTTPSYSPPVPPGASLSPEQDAAGERFDIYMLGATLAEALGLARLDDATKRQLYGTAHENGVAKQRLAALGGSPILTTLIASCLADPSFRTRDVHSIQADLARARDGAVLSSVLLGAP